MRVACTCRYTHLCLLAEAKAKAGCQACQSVCHFVPVRQGFSLTWKLPIRARLAGQRSPSFSGSQCWVTGTHSYTGVGARFCPQVLMLTYPMDQLPSSRTIFKWHKTPSWKKKIEGQKEESVYVQHSFVFKCQSIIIKIYTQVHILWVTLSSLRVRDKSWIYFVVFETGCSNLESQFLGYQNMGTCISS